jgi:hypothetical protein
VRWGWGEWGAARFDSQYPVSATEFGSSALLLATTRSVHTTQMMSVNWAEDLQFRAIQGESCLAHVAIVRTRRTCNRACDVRDTFLLRPRQVADCALVTSERARPIPLGAPVGHGTNKLLSFTCVTNRSTAGGFVQTVRNDYVCVICEI